MFRAAPRRKATSQATAPCGLIRELSRHGREAATAMWRLPLADSFRNETHDLSKDTPIIIDLKIDMTRAV